MLQLVATSNDKSRAQKKLKAALQSALDNQGRHNIGYPGGNSDHTVYAAGRGLLYYAYSSPRAESRIPRYWNSFGVFRPGETQQITVEINVPAHKNDGRVAGFFASDPETGELFLMHDGGIGGGRPGIGKEAFLGFISDELVPVSCGAKVRYGLPIARLDDPNLASLIWRFVRKVETFKEAASTGSLVTTNGDGAGYSPEFWGRKQGERSGAFDYISYHGMIVDGLKVERERTLQSGETIGRDRLVDLFVSRGGRRTEIYEVKTCAGRQSLYTAIGQLMIHAQNGARRVLVLPKGEELPQDCNKALTALKIGIRGYQIKGSGMKARVEFTSF